MSGVCTAVSVAITACSGRLRSVLLSKGLSIKALETPCLGDSFGEFIGRNEVACGRCFVESGLFFNTDPKCLSETVEQAIESMYSTLAVNRLKKVHIGKDRLILSLKHAKNIYDMFKLFILEYDSFVNKLEHESFFSNVKDYVGLTCSFIKALSSWTEVFTRYSVIKTYSNKSIKVPVVDIAGSILQQAVCGSTSLCILKSDDREEAIRHSIKNGVPSLTSVRYYFKDDFDIEDIIYVLHREDALNCIADMSSEFVRVTAAISAVFPNDYLLSFFSRQYFEAYTFIDNIGGYGYGNGSRAGFESLQ